MISPCLDTPLASHLQRFRGLIQPGIVGNFTHCELTEIFANVEGVSGPQNVFTLAVLEERGIAAPSRFLNPNRLSLQGLKGWSFGICRTLMNLPEFKHGLAQFDATGIWSTGVWFCSGDTHQARLPACSRFNDITSASTSSHVL